MTTIRIRELDAFGKSPNAAVSVDGEGEFRATVTDPFAEEQERRLEWYFEEHLRLPFVQQETARAVAASIRPYGEALFRQVFGDQLEVYARCKEGLQAGIEGLRFEVAGSPDFHRLHWEALKDPKLPDAFVLHAPLVRKTLKEPPALRAQAQASPTVNVLLVVARPKAARDVGYRTISWPLVAGLRRAELRVVVDIVRPGTYAALVEQLEDALRRHGAGHYHVVHLDVHGALLAYEELRRGAEASQYLYQARYGRDDIQPYKGQKAFLFLEGAQADQADPVEAAEVANLLLHHRAPIVVLNACQSGMQVGATETSLASRLLEAGAQAVLAMSYSVTVSAAEALGESLYRELFGGRQFSAAVCRGRHELHHRKGRRAYFNQQIDLEDWMLPVVYENRDPQLCPRSFTPEEEQAHCERQAGQYAYPRPEYGFFGRDLDILEIEKRLLAKSNVLLVGGMGGAGKTTLLRHLGAWWQQTGLVEEVFYFGYDEKAWTRDQILYAIAQRVLNKYEFVTFQGMKAPAQQVSIAERLRARRRLLILDNLESITGAHLAIRNTLEEAERECLRALLAELVGGNTLVLLGSRGGEDWLAGGTFGDNVYDLPGLDEEAASRMADAILRRQNATQYREDADFKKLLELLDGYPLALEVVLANLARQKPGEVLQALVAGDQRIDARDRQTKTESIIRCIDYSYSNLSVEAQKLLLCLAPFTGVVNGAYLDEYANRLKDQPALVGMRFEGLAEVLREAGNWGLLRPDEAPGFLRLQPVLPFFLRSRWQTETVEFRTAVEAAFREHYDRLAGGVVELQNSKEPEDKQAGQKLAELEYENLAAAVRLALRAEESIFGPHASLSSYLDVSQDHRRGLELGQEVLNALEKFAPERLAGRLGVEFALVVGDIGNRQLRLKQYAAAEASYGKALELNNASTVLDAPQKGCTSAGILHQLGIVAQEQRQWRKAEDYYQKALAIKIEFNDRYEQARTYHELGRVAQAQRQWRQAEEHYQKALAIKIEFNARYEQASTYHQLGMVAQAQRQWRQAEEYYQKALAIDVEFGDRYEQAGTYHQLGRVAEEQGQWAQARGHFREALAIVAEYKDMHSLGIVLTSLGRLWRATADEGIVTDVAEVLKLARKDAEELLRGPSEEE